MMPSRRSFFTFLPVMVRGCTSRSIVCAMRHMLQYGPVSFYLQITQIVVSLALMVLVLAQSRGSGLTQPSMEQTTLFRTRRGFEKTMFQLTLLLAAVWVLVSIATVLSYNAF